jgi:hypothetical protein
VKRIVAFVVLVLISATMLVAAEPATLFSNYLASDNQVIETDVETDPPPDLVVNDELPKWQSKVFEVADVMPGDSGAATLKLQNVGGNGTLELQFLNLKDESITTPEPEPIPDDGELSQNLDMLIWWDDNNNGVYEPPGETLIAEDILYNIAGVIYNLGSLNNTETKYLGIAWSVDSTVGNEIMGDKCTFDIQFGMY